MTEKRYYISGWAGQSDEDGAQVVDRKTGKSILHTAPQYKFADYAEYRRSAEKIVAALNSYRPRKRKVTGAS